AQGFMTGQRTSVKRGPDPGFAGIPKFMTRVTMDMTLEPTASFYQRLADGYAFLARKATASGKDKALAADAQTMSRLLRGMSLIALSELGLDAQLLTPPAADDAAATTAAEAWLKGPSADAALGADARGAWDFGGGQLAFLGW